MNVQKAKNYFWHLPKAVAANILFGFPSNKLTLIAVTGTKGKTSTVHLIYHILSSQRIPVGMISTIGAVFGKQKIETGLHVTSPGPFALQRLLSLGVRKKLKYMVLEVTSSGLDQYRVWGLRFKVGVITNIADDHLDYHGSVDEYIRVKASLARVSETMVVNRLSDHFDQILGHVKKFGSAIIEVTPPHDSPTESNRELAVRTVGLLGIDEKKARRALTSFPGVPGRFERLYEASFTVVNDFAHTPDSLEAALRELRDAVRGEGRLIAVFGCAGERDPGRRKMGAVAAKLADVFIVTAEDPRSESAFQISEQIAFWARAAGAVEVTPDDPIFEAPKDQLQKVYFTRIIDRQQAINAAVSVARRGDVVGLFGKGHEKSMAIGKNELPWSEERAVGIALRQRKRL